MAILLGIACQVILPLYKKNIVSLQDLSGSVSLNLLPPIPELANIKELIAFHTLGDELIGFSLPPEIKQIKEVLVQLKTALNIDDVASEDAFNSLLINIKNLEQIEDDQTHSFKEALDSCGWQSIKYLKIIIKSFLF